MLIRRRIENHEKRINNENKSNKIIYDVGDRVRIQDVKTKQFSKNGTVTEQRRTDSGTIVSYLIKKDNGRVTIRHWKFLRKLEPENDPLIDIIDTNLKSTDATVENLADIPLDEEIASNSTGRNAADSNSEVVGKYHSGKSADYKFLIVGSINFTGD